MIFRKEVYPKVHISSFKNSDNERGIIQVVERRVTTNPRMGCDKNYEEDFKKLSDIVETVHDFYEAITLFAQNLIEIYRSSR